MLKKFVSFVTAVLLASPALSAELLMVEQDGCYYCELWDSQIADIYPKTAEGAAAPLRRMDIHDDVPSDLIFARALYFTPTFVLVEDGQELARIEGYPGEDFFWGLLEVILTEHIDFEGQS